MDRIFGSLCLCVHWNIFCFMCVDQFLDTSCALMAYLLVFFCLMERLVCVLFIVFLHLVWLPVSSAGYFCVCLESLFNVWEFGPSSWAAVVVLAVTWVLRAPRSMRKGVCTTSGLCVCVGCSLGLLGGLKWIPSCWLFHVPPAWPTMPLCSCPTALWDSCYLRGRGWPPPTFSFKVRMVNSCYPVSWWLAQAAERIFSGVGVKVFCCLLACLHASLFKSH